MSAQHAALTVDEIAQRGDAIYSRLRESVESQNIGKVIAIDVDSEAFEIAAIGAIASRNLRQHHPNAEIWLVRIGDTVFRRLRSV